MITLNTTSAVTQFNAPMSTMQSGGQFKIEIPQSTIMIPKPVSFEFRVAEFVDGEGNIKKVGLQYKMWEHDQYGSPLIRHDWVDVPRIQLPFVE
jgi:hypothetical protein